MFDILPQPLKDFVDTIFNPPKAFLQQAVNYLNDISLIAGRGINLSNYLGFIAYLPPAWQSVINSFFSAVIFLAILWIIKVIMANYYSIKQAIKWW
ncbi:MAG: hypothetical protein IMW85_00890 [Thermicanus sp.]|nr:hypothetical protein [Thermicanus sp.]